MQWIASLPGHDREEENMRSTIADKKMDPDPLVVGFSPPSPPPMTANHQDAISLLPPQNTSKSLDNFQRRDCGLPRERCLLLDSPVVLKHCRSRYVAEDGRRGESFRHRQRYCYQLQTGFIPCPKIPSHSRCPPVPERWPQRQSPG